MSCASTIVFALLAWFAGLLIDANIGFEPAGFLCLRVVLPMIVLAICILKTINDKKDR